MKLKITISYVIILIVALIISFFTNVITIRNTTYNNSEEELISVINDINAIFSYIDEDNINDYMYEYDNLNDIRITLINLDGSILFDTRSAAIDMENHSDREEFIEAINDDIGIDTRESSTIGINLLYVAKEIDFYGNDVVLRVSKPQAVINSLFLSILNNTLLGLIIGGILSYPIALYRANKVLYPLKKLSDSTHEVIKGNYNTQIMFKSYKEIDDLAYSFNEMTISIKNLISKYEARKAELEAITNSINIGLIAVDMEDNIIFYNEKLTNLFNINSDIINHQIQENIFDINLENVLNFAKINGQGEIKNVRNVENYILNYKSTQIVNNINDVIGYLIVIEDVTKVKKLETMRRDFVSNVTHELKTPLTSIKGFTETLRLLPDDDIQNKEKFLSIIDIETERLTMLINDILVLQEIEEIGHFNLYDVDASKLLNESITETKHIMESNVTLSLNIEDNIIIKADTEKLRQLYTNLISNAMKYTHKGEINISLYNKNNQNIFEINDTGVGIPKKDIDRVFERFYRVDKARSRKTGGTGLGLSIVKHICEILNAQIKLDSKLDEGTNIKIIFSK